MIPLQPVEKLQAIFSTTRTIAVVGLSPKKSRPSYQVADYMIQAGYNVIPVNPGQNEILGRVCYPDLQSIPEPVDVVDIFRRADQVVPVIQEAIAIGARVVWMQQGIINDQAAVLAENAGLLVIMDRCLKVEHMQLANR